MIRALEHVHMLQWHLAIEFVVSLNNYVNQYICDGTGAAIGGGGGGRSEGISFPSASAEHVNLPTPQCCRTIACLGRLFASQRYVSTERSCPFGLSRIVHLRDLRNRTGF